ncbi:MAG: four helix bundle protein [Acidobacteria bacterium]|nr:four helix bundle protein [Acidobacteriota bacterium]
MEIKHFTDLEVWKKARQLRKEIYRAVKLLPPEERTNLTSQMRRAAVSITANVAEGFGRYHYKENRQFCRQSRGSLYELQDHLITCVDQGYFSRQLFEALYEQSMAVARLQNGYIRSIGRQTTNDQ